MRWFGQIGIPQADILKCRQTDTIMYRTVKVLCILLVGQVRVSQPQSKRYSFATQCGAWRPITKRCRNFIKVRRTWQLTKSHTNSLLASDINLCKSQSAWGSKRTLLGMSWVLGTGTSYWQCPLRKFPASLVRGVWQGSVVVLPRI